MLTFWTNQSNFNLTIMFCPKWAVSTTWGVYDAILSPSSYGSDAPEW